MFGTLRLILAILVVCTHLRVRIYGVDQGMAAVMLFFLLSGYVMTGLVRRYIHDGYDDLKNSAARFFLPAWSPDAMQRPDVRL